MSLLHLYVLHMHTYLQLMQTADINFCGAHLGLTVTAKGMLNGFATVHVFRKMVFFCKGICKSEKILYRLASYF